MTPHTMTRAQQPVLLVLAAWSGERWTARGAGLGRAADPRSVLFATLQRALASQLPIVLVTTSALGNLARGLLAVRDIVIVPPARDASGYSVDGYAVAMGVAARPNGAGWVVLPGDMPLVLPGTMAAVARGLDHCPVAVARHEGRNGRPVAFSAELYSELIQLNDFADATRLLSRYPAYGVEVDDPGVLMDIDEIDDFDVLRQSFGLPQAQSWPQK